MVTGGEDPERLRVLYVDDDKLMRITVTRILERRHEVTAAASGREALAILTADPAYDVVLSDVNMQRIDGPTLMRTIRARDMTSARLILWSGQPSDETERFAAAFDIPLFSKASTEPLSAHLFAMLAGGATKSDR